MSLSFDNLEIAFKHQSNRELRQAKRLFKIFSFPVLVESGPKWINIALRWGLPIKSIVKRTVFHQFCGGEDIESSYSSAQALANYGVGAILDYSVEGGGNESSYKACFDELLAVIKYASDRPEFPFAVFKCTGIGSAELMQKVSQNQVLTAQEEEEYQRFTERVRALCQAAHDADVPIFIDAEESWLQIAIDNLSYQMMGLYNSEKTIVFNTVQLYRKNQLSEIEKQLDRAKEGGYKLGLKLVRGAYMEKEALRAKEYGYPSPIQDSKADTDKDYNDALDYCIHNVEVISICAGTHNEESSLLLANLMHENRLSKSDPRIWFAQLYGMSDHISFNLAAEGYNVAKYLPYGPLKGVLPYLARRAKENSAVKGQAGRELSLIIRELKRRKNVKLNP